MNNEEKKCYVVRGEASYGYSPISKDKGRKRKNTLLEMASLPEYSTPGHSHRHNHRYNRNDNHKRSHNHIHRQNHSDSYDQSWGGNRSQKNPYNRQILADVPYVPSFQEMVSASSLADFPSLSVSPPTQYAGFGDTGSSATHFSNENNFHIIRTHNAPSLLNVSKNPESVLSEGSLSQTSVNFCCRRHQRCTVFEDARREMEMGDSEYFSEDDEGEALDVNCSSSQFSYYNPIKDSEAHSLSERKRRKRINEKMRALQELIPNSNKVTDKASMLDEAIEYLKMLQMQIQNMALGNGLMMSFMMPYMQMPIFNPLIYMEYMALARPWVESSIGSSVFQGNMNWAPFGMSPMTSFLDPIHAPPRLTMLPIPSSVAENFIKNPQFHLPQG